MITILNFWDLNVEFKLMQPEPMWRFCALDTFRRRTIPVELMDLYDFLGNVENSDFKSYLYYTYD